MPTSPLTISFVSGKGGVGKTSLAANFAWICSTISKTVLIDLDFQNQGCTGLFMTTIARDRCGSFEVLCHLTPFETCDPTRVEENLSFVPAVSIAQPAEYSRIAEKIRDPGLRRTLCEYLAFLRQRHSFDTVILDCHGGLDYVSIAAYEASSHTIVVTEADAVTFNGTLELLSFYDSEQTTETCTPAGVRSGLTEQGKPLEAHRSPQQGGERRLEFVVNRLPPKYKFSDLDSTYRRLLQGYRGPLNLNHEVLSFIPEETFIAESFGEYSFCVKLAPTSIFARKLQLMALELLRPSAESLRHYSPFRKLRRVRFPGRVKRTMLSAESENMRNIIYAFGWSASALSFGIVFAIMRVFASVVPAVFAKIFDAVAVVVTVVLWVLVIKAEFGLAVYYRERYGFRRAMLRATGETITPWHRLSLLRLRILRLGTALGLVFTIPLAVFCGYVLLFLLH